MDLFGKSEIFLNSSGTLTFEKFTQKPPRADYKGFQAARRQFTMRYACGKSKVSGCKVRCVIRGTFMVGSVFM
jgi:hypothetical protein